MIGVALLFAQAVAPATAPAPSAETLALAERVAGSGTFSRLAPLMIAEQTEALVRDAKGLTAADQADLRREAKAQADAAIVRVRHDMALAYAARLSAADLKAIAQFNESPVARRYAAATPVAVAAAQRTMAGFDLARATRAAFCTRTGKLCTP